MKSISQRLLLACLTNSFLIVHAQTMRPAYEVGISAGGLIYQGDLAPSWVGSYKTIQPQVAVFGQRTISQAFAIRAGLAFGRLKGDESKYAQPAWRQQRNLRFSTPVVEASALLVWNPAGYRQSRLAPYVFAGIGYAFLSIRRDWSRYNAAYFGAETGTLPGLAPDTAHALPGGIPVIPAGIGIRYALTNHLSIVAESTYRQTFTDYADGFSHSGNTARKDHYYGQTFGVIYQFGRNNSLRCPVWKN